MKRSFPFNSDTTMTSNTPSSSSSSSCLFLSSNISRSCFIHSSLSSTVTVAPPQPLFNIWFKADKFINKVQVSSGIDVSGLLDFILTKLRGMVSSINVEPRLLLSHVAVKKLALTEPELNDLFTDYSEGSDAEMFMLDPQAQLNEAILLKLNQIAQGPRPDRQYLIIPQGLIPFSSFLNASVSSLISSFHSHDCCCPSTSEEFCSCIHTSHRGYPQRAAIPTSQTA